MNTATIQVVEQICRDIVSMAQAIMDNDTIGSNRKTGQNSLRDSALRNNVKASVAVGNNVVIDVLFDNYIEYIENGRRPGKMPPISALKDWARSRNIPDDNNTLFAIANAIKRDGFAGRPILATLEQEIENRFQDEWGDMIFEALTEEITKYFDS